MADSINDSLMMHNSDHPGMVLVTVPMSGENFLTWRRSMKLALEAKVKLGFVDGTIPPPPPDITDPTYKQWKRVNSMVKSWILNSISKEIVQEFLYADSARELWQDLEQRYGQCNGPLLYQIKRELSSISQGTMSLATYFSKLKALWDELACLNDVPVCSNGDQCGILQHLEQAQSRDMLIQFLIGLNDSYDVVRDQLLIMDPLPTVNTAYSIISGVESQSDLQICLNKKDKEDRYCDICNTPRHTRETCFRLHGYPDWYKALKESRGTGGGNSGSGSSNQNRTSVANSATLMESPLEGVNDVASSSFDWNSTISTIIKQEMAKYMKGNTMQNAEQAHSAANLAEKNHEEVEEKCVISQGEEAVAEVRKKVDKLKQQVSALQAAVDGGTKVDDKKIVHLTELLMGQLFKLDGIEAEGEGKLQRRKEVRRVQSMVDSLDALKSRNSNAFSNTRRTLPVHSPGRF